MDSLDDDSTVVIPMDCTDNLAVDPSKLGQWVLADGLDEIIVLMNVLPLNLLHLINISRKGYWSLI